VAAAPVVAPDLDGAVDYLLRQRQATP
jgi:hypothetical protein